MNNTTTTPTFATYRRAVRREFTKAAKHCAKYDNNWINYGVRCVNILGVQFPSLDGRQFVADMTEIGNRYLNA